MPCTNIRGGDIKDVFIFCKDVKHKCGCVLFCLSIGLSVLEESLSSGFLIGNEVLGSVGSKDYSKSN